HGDFCVCQLTGITGISQPNVSKHLARLRDMGMVKDERREQYTFYSLSLDEKLHEDILAAIIAEISNYPTLRLDVEKSKAAMKYLEIKSREAESEESQENR
ncbi:MAG: helix-turn-helix transcriptional regulator, partial [Clostridiaceae bacterium]|nr:helix-turn-helix transcriptional regulator [Clostridiaceae bacterium]